MGGLSDGPLATGGSRASSRQHQVQDSHADGSLSLLGSEAARSHPRSDQSLITAHRRFDQCALAVVGGCLPGQSAPFRDHRQMAIPLCRRTRIGAGHGRRPRWDHHVAPAIAHLVGVGALGGLCRASHSGTSSVRRTQRGRAGQWRIKGQPRRANRAGAGTGQSGRQRSGVHPAR